MAIELRWLDEDAGTLLWRFSGQWTWEHFFMMLPRANKMAESKGTNVAVIMDFSQSRTGKTNLLGLFSSAGKRVASNVSVIVFIGHPIIPALVNTYNLIYPKSRFYVAAGHEPQDALAIIRSYRAIRGEELGLKLQPLQATSVSA
jgi:hypothetical protein